MLRFSFFSDDFQRGISNDDSVSIAWENAVGMLIWDVVPRLELLRPGDILLASCDKSLLSLSKAVHCSHMKIAGFDVLVFLVDRLDYSDETIDGKGGNLVIVPWATKGEQNWNEGCYSELLYTSVMVEGLRGYYQGSPFNFMGGIRFQYQYKPGSSYEFTRGENKSYLYKKKNGFWRIYDKIDRMRDLPDMGIDEVLTKDPEGRVLTRPLTFGDVVCRCLFDENGNLVNPREIDASEGLRAIKNRYMTEQQLTRAEFLKEVKRRVFRESDRRRTGDRRRMHGVPLLQN